MAKFPVDAPKTKVIKACEALGFRVVRQGNHISMLRENPDGTRTLLTMPNHRNDKGFDVTHDTYTGRHIER